MKSIKCGLCNKKEFISDRRGMREHLRVEHKILKNITNSMYKRGVGYVKQSWWIECE